MAGWPPAGLAVHSLFQSACFCHCSALLSRKITTHLLTKEQIHAPPTAARLAQPATIAHSCANCFRSCGTHILQAQRPQSRTQTIHNCATTDYLSCLRRHSHSAYPMYTSHPHAHAPLSSPRAAARHDPPLKQPAPPTLLSCPVQQLRVTPGWLSCPCCSLNWHLTHAPHA